MVKTPRITVMTIPLVVTDRKRADAMAVETAVQRWAACKQLSGRTALRRDAAIGETALAGGRTTALRLRGLLEGPQTAPYQAGLDIAGIQETKYGGYGVEPRVEEGVLALFSPPSQRRERGTGDHRAEDQDEKSRRIMAELEVGEVIYRMQLQENHGGLVVRSPAPRRARKNKNKRLLRMVVRSRACVPLVQD